MALCLDEGDERVFKMTRVSSGKLPRDARYRLSLFCFRYEEGSCHLLHNLFTLQVASLEQYEFDAMEALRDGIVDFAYLERHGLLQLAEWRFIVEEGYDECEAYLTMLKLLNIMRKPSDGIKTYILYPTTACNARCTYCYEQGFVPATMTDETLDGVIDYIDRTKASRPIRIRWFGGEPLAAASLIDRASSELLRREIEFESDIVTNASLITPELAQRARELWHLSAAQVSVDGRRGDFERRKRFVDPSNHTYDLVMRNVHLLLDQGVKVQLRCNYDEGNLEGLSEFVDDLGREFAGVEQLCVYFALLFQARALPQAPDLIRRKRAVEDKAFELGLLGEQRSQARAFKTHFCMADDLDRSCAIDPQGRLQNCEHLDEANIFGNVWEGVCDQKRFDQLSGPYPVEPSCRSCPFLPLCTPFCKRGCPDLRSDFCRQVKSAEEENKLHRMALKLVREA